NIDQDAKPLIIPTPYDTSLFTLNQKLNRTYIPYGEGGMESSKIMGEPDTSPVYSTNDPTKIDRYVVRSDKNVYYNPQWDMLDAMDKDGSIIDTVELKNLPDSLKIKSRDQLKEIVKNKTAERRIIQKHI